MRLRPLDKLSTANHLEGLAGAAYNLPLSISDNGPGAPVEQLKALYDENVSSGAKHGLGLHIIRDLAKAIHCTITLKSQVRPGTEFVLSIPNMVSNGHV